MKSRMLKVALAVAVFLAMTGASFAQAPWWQQRNDDGRYEDRDRWGGWGYQGNGHGPYDRGFSDGRQDRLNRRGWSPRNNGKKYLEGYREGYGRNGGGWQGRRDRDHDGDDDGYHRSGTWPYGNGPYGNGPYGNRPNGTYDINNVQQTAYSNGYREGLSYGSSDRNGGHSYRPTSSSTYQKGSNGYIAPMGDKNAYKHAFQDGFRAGYDRGYNGAGYRR